MALPGIVIQRVENPSGASQSWLVTHAHRDIDTTVSTDARVDEDVDLFFSLMKEGVCITYLLTPPRIDQFRSPHRRRAQKSRRRRAREDRRDGPRDAARRYPCW